MRYSMMKKPLCSEFSIITPKFLECLNFFIFYDISPDEDQAVFQRNLQKELRQDSSDDVADKFVEGYQEYIEEPARCVVI